MHVFPADGARVDALCERGALVVDMRSTDDPLKIMEYPEPDLSVGGRGATPIEAVHNLIDLLPLLLPANPDRVAVLAERLRGLTAEA